MCGRNTPDELKWTLLRSGVDQQAEPEAVRRRLPDAVVQIERRQGKRSHRSYTGACFLLPRCFQYFTQ